ncbi:MAG: VCBS repeat-containing protein [Candidatus Eremiobacteraeota bacterium]|nr:VCBS repeat-containing protein [Candidatus Eremiobacteraeota bacterium]
MRDKRSLTLFLLAIAAVMLITGGSALPQDDYTPPKAGQIYKTMQCDLNGDGVREKIAVKVTKVIDEGWLGQLIVMDEKGKVLWEGPKGKDVKDSTPLVMRSLDWGVSLPELLADIDGDGKVEMLVPEPISDVRPCYYRSFRWNGKGFDFLQSRALIESAPKSGLYKWSSTKEYKTRWIMNFSQGKSGSALLVGAYDMTDGCSYGRAEVKPAPGGFKIVRWIEPMKKSE